jgi:lycopene beta-cyclase
VALDDGSELTASVVIDAAGRWQPLRQGRVARTSAEQTAFGVVVPAEAAAPLVPAGEALFMDWRPDHGEGGWPTFLYGIPIGAGEVLLEETSLARRPGLPVAVLRRRLHARLAHHGIPIPPDARTETVRFPVDRPRHDVPGVLGFGAAAPLVHPATGFSLAAALGLAGPVADAVAAHLPAGPEAALAAAREVVWPRSAKAVHGFRRIGLEALLRMPPEEVPGFFDVFFDLPERQRWAYLTGRDDLSGTVATMGGLFAASGWRLRRRLVVPAVLPPLRANDEPAGPCDLHAGLEVEDVAVRVLEPRALEVVVGGDPVDPGEPLGLERAEGDPALAQGLHLGVELVPGDLEGHGRGPVRPGERRRVHEEDAGPGRVEHPFRRLPGAGEAENLLVERPGAVQVRHREDGNAVVVAEHGFLHGRAGRPSSGRPSSRVRTGGVGRPWPQMTMAALRVATRGTRRSG